MSRKNNWKLLVLACAMASASCAKPRLILIDESPPPLPKVSVDMPRPPETISSDVERTLSDLDSKLLQLQQLLIP